MFISSFSETYLGLSVHLTAGEKKRGKRRSSGNEIEREKKRRKRGMYVCVYIHASKGTCWYVIK